MKIKIEVSARHMHLCQKDLEKLFGGGYKLTRKKELSQHGQFAAEEMVSLVGPDGEIKNVRILGPGREQTQVEISDTDSKILGINPPVRDSGNLTGSAGVKVVGPAGEINLFEGVILAKRHIHIDPATAEKIGVKNGDRVKVDVSGDRDLLFENVLIRVDNNYRLAMHIDTDEANAAGIDEINNVGEIIV